MIDRKRVLIIAFSPIKRDPRVMRQLRLLENEFAVTVVGFGDHPRTDVEFVALSAASPAKIPQGLKSALKRVLGQFDPRLIPSRLALFLGRFETHYWGLAVVRRALDLMNHRDFDLVIANDIRTLPLALRIADGAPVLFDAHEYAPLQYEDRWWWMLMEGRLYRYLCKRYLPSARSMTTVCESIADKYAEEFGIQPLVIRNALPDARLRPSPAAAGRIRMVHHGAAVHSRRLDLMIEVMRRLDDRFTLDLVLIESDPAYFAWLKELAAGDRRIRFLTPVPMDAICSMLNAYDLGIAFFPPINFNYAHCLPNKFFEFIQARIGIAIGPSVEMARVMREYPVGIVAESFKADDIAAALGRLTDADIARFKAASDAAAPVLSFDVEGDRLLREIRRLVSG